MGGTNCQQLEGGWTKKRMYFIKIDLLLWKVKDVIVPFFIFGFCGGGGGGEKYIYIDS